MKGHVGVYATEGTGAIYSSSNKLKLNTVNSMETQLVGVGEKLPKCLWYRMFRIAQGGYDNEDVLMQDNQSTMLLENNGRYSVGKGSRHVDIRYFFITDRIQKKHVKVQYCPTEEIIADFFTKPLQGALFYKFRDLVLGIRAEDYEEYRKKYYEILTKFDLMDSSASDKSKECVERELSLTTDRRNEETNRVKGSEADSDIGVIVKGHNHVIVNPDCDIYAKHEKACKIDVRSLWGGRKGILRSSHFSKIYPV